jgi:hypothetical protein
LASFRSRDIVRVLPKETGVALKRCPKVTLPVSPLAMPRAAALSLCQRATSSAGA